MHSIRFKITAITVAAILTTILCVLVVSYFTLKAENDRNSVGMMNLIGENTGKSIEKYTENIEKSVEMAANIAVDSLDSVVLVECGAAGRENNEKTPELAVRLDEYLKEYSEKVCSAFASVASHTHGVMTYYYCINPEISETEHGFFYSRVGKTGFYQQEPLDARTLDPDDIEHTTWYFTPIKRGRPSWVGPYKAHFLNEMWVCSYIVPIYKAGALIGVLGMDISVDTLIAQVENIRVYETGFACLLDENGKVVSHPKLDFGSDPLISVLPGSEGLIAHESSGGELIRYTVNGEKRQMSFSTLSNGMKLIVTAPQSEVMAGWTRLIRNNAVITAAITLVFAIIIMIAMRFMTRPLLRLAEASRRLADEDYDAELLEYSGHDEIGTLTASFNSMRDRIKSYIEDLNRKVNTDDLTGLPNMRRFFSLAEQERDRLLKYGRRPAMIFFDLIGMKLYNRQYGFSEGDKLIRGVGKIIASHYGENCVCHYSDDHFAAVGDMETLEARLKEVFRDCEKANGGNSLPVRVGVYPHGLEEVSVSIACDRAKYACDRHRGSFVSDYYIFDETMSRQLEDVRYLINHLDQALEERWITVYYQPIVRAATGKVCDEEALSRWIDPVKGMISPGVFIPIFERGRLIYKLDLYVLDRILEKMKEQERMGLPVVPHSVNLSREDFDSCDIVEEVRRRVDEAGIGHDMITIEVTESMVGSDFEFMKEQIRRFQELGFAVWMDDFGSGYSSLDVLQDIRFDLLKFDLRFMQRFGEGRESRIILEELMNMASRLGIETVCEGVETEEQLSFLRGVGCTKMQGFYYSKPIPFEEIAERCEKGAWIGYETGKR